MPYPANLDALTVSHPALAALVRDYEAELTVIHPGWRSAKRQEPEWVVTICHVEILFWLIFCLNWVFANNAKLFGVNESGIEAVFLVYPGLLVVNFLYQVRALACGERCGRS